jgi:hypothetical protein
MHAPPYTHTVSPPHSKLLLDAKLLAGIAKIAHGASERASERARERERERARARESEREREIERERERERERDPLPATRARSSYLTGRLTRQSLNEIGGKESYCRYKGMVDVLP